MKTLKYDLAERLAALMEVLEENGYQPHLRIRGHRVDLTITTRNPKEAMEILKFCVERDAAKNKKEPSI
jgi:hypothetical protein